MFIVSTANVRRNINKLHCSGYQDTVKLQGMNMLMHWPKRVPKLHKNVSEKHHKILLNYEGWNFNSGNYLFTTDTKYIHVSKFYCPSM